jgi:hypothetical protein
MRRHRSIDAAATKHGRWRLSNEELMGSPVIQLFATGAISAMIVVSAVLASAKTPKGCDVEYSHNKVAIKAEGQTKKDFIAACQSRSRASPTAPTPDADAAPVGY